MSTIDHSINGVSLSAYMANGKMTWQNLGDVVSISFIKNPMTQSKNHSTILQPVYKQVFPNQTKECYP